MENKERKISDAECTAKWKSLLQVFHDIIESNPTAEKVSAELNSLKEMAKKSEELTERQVDAILGRCDNYINGNYGNTKSKSNLNYQNV